MQALAVLAFVVLWVLITASDGFAEKDTLSGHWDAIRQGLHLTILKPFYLLWDRLGPKVWHYFEASDSPSGWPATAIGIALWWASGKLLGLLNEPLRDARKNIRAIRHGFNYAVARQYETVDKNSAISVFRQNPWIIIEVVILPIFFGRWIIRRVTTGYDGVFDFLLGATTGFMVWAFGTAMWVAVMLGVLGLVSGK